MYLSHFISYQSKIDLQNHIIIFKHTLQLQGKHEETAAVSNLHLIKITMALKTAHTTYIIDCIFDTSLHSLLQSALRQPHITLICLHILFEYAIYNYDWCYIIYWRLSTLSGII